MVSQEQQHGGAVTTFLIEKVVGTTNPKMTMVSFRAIAQYYSAGSKTIEWELRRAVVLLLLTCLDVQLGSENRPAESGRQLICNRQG